MLESIRTEEVSDWLLGQTSACRALKLTVVQKSGLPMTPENSRVEKVNFTVDFERRRWGVNSC
jgi:hypothetical protein